MVNKTLGYSLLPDISVALLIHYADVQIPNSLEFLLQNGPIYLDEILDDNCHDAPIYMPYSTMILHPKTTRGDITHNEQLHVYILQL
uniref:Uncharacterized protein n=1 Tax=Arundo donax TaxID=35708 RepID=A0A0A9FA34_ARUDO